MESNSNVFLPSEVNDSLPKPKKKSKSVSSKSLNTTFALGGSLLLTIAFILFVLSIQMGNFENLSVRSILQILDNSDMTNLFENNITLITEATEKLESFRDTSDFSGNWWEDTKVFFKTIGLTFNKIITYFYCFGAFLINVFRTLIDIIYIIFKIIGM